MIMALDVLYAPLTMLEFKTWESIFVLAAPQTATIVLGTPKQTRQPVKTATTVPSYLPMGSAFLVEMTNRHKDVLNVMN